MNVLECSSEQQYARHGEPAVGPDPQYRNCKHQTLELNQFIPHITHMLEFGGASLGPHGITALPQPTPHHHPDQSIIHMQYQMYGRGLETATNTKYLRTQPCADMKHSGSMSHTSKNGGLLILQKPSAPRVQTTRSQMLLKACKDRQTSCEWYYSIY